MCKGIGLFLRSKAKKIMSFIDYIDVERTKFQIINVDFSTYSKYISKLSKNNKYSKTVENYNNCVENIKQHNDMVRELNIKCNSLIKAYPIVTILEHVLNIDKSKLIEISLIFDQVYKFSIPAKFENKKQYDAYRKILNSILEDYDLVCEQSRILKEINSEIAQLPDIYIDETNFSKVLGRAVALVEKYKSFNKFYYPIPIVNINTVEDHNEEFVSRHCADPIFDDINGKSLDIEQRRAILCDAKSNLTIAGAGSGKTLTICGKVKYLLEKGIAQSDDILLLSYSRASADDLEEKIKHIADGIRVDTFHALGLQILTEVDGKKKNVEEQLKSHITNFFRREIVKDQGVANDIFQYLALYFYAAPVYKKQYKNDGELFKDLKSSDFKTLKDRLKGLSTDITKKETIQKELVKSNEELAIANYLFINGIRYEYEKPYEIDTSTIEKRQYTPDFYLPDYKIYLEHYGIDRKGNALQYDKKGSEEYVQSMQWKRKIHEENQTKCIETFSYEFNEGVIFQNLKTKLLDCGVEFRPLSQEEIFNALHNVYSGKDYTSFFNLVMTFISLYKAQIKDEKGFIELKSNINGEDYDSHRAKLFLDICRNVYMYYMRNLRETDKIDFDDMILQSVEKLDLLPDRFRYKYIIVDEFQDISRSRTQFLKKLIQHGNSKLFAVGDDWQAIYRFAGCDINIFLEFKKEFANAKLNYITSTHRNSQELQNIVEPFITQNPRQYKKHISSNKTQNNPVRIIYHQGNKVMALTKALEDISKIKKDAKVLVLGRNRKDIDSFVSSDIQAINYEKIEHNSFTKFDISYSTVHGSKGLESDFVILISGEDAPAGFPNKTEDDKVLELLLGNKSDYEYAEERRLFYVALTRTKSIVYLLSDKNMPSEFVLEIEQKCLILEDESKTKDDVEYLCPCCKSGKLIVREEKETKRRFYGCSNYPFCTYTNSDMKSVYYNNRCPECGDFLVQRKNSDGISFFGCHNYPRCKYTQSKAPRK